MNKKQRQASEKPVVRNRGQYPKGVSGNIIGRAPRDSGEVGQIQMLRSAVVSLIRCGGAQFARDIQSLKPKDRVNTILSLLRMVLPKVRPVEVPEDVEANAAESVSDLLRMVYDRKSSVYDNDEVDDDFSDEPSEVNDLLRSVRGNMRGTRRNDPDEDDDFDEDD